MKISDLTGILEIHKLPLVKKYSGEGNSTVFEFDIEGQQMDWIPGQHGIFTLPQKKISGKSWRAFSFASVSSEKILKIATKIGDEPSSFKQALNSLEYGEEITVRGPYGWFYLKDKISTVVMIAGGIGITPMRALFKELEISNDREVTLIYSSKDTYLFKEELDDISKSDKKINIKYLHEKEEVEKEVTEVSGKYGNNAYYFISGTVPMIEGLKKQLSKRKIRNNRIITDSFKGY